MWIRSRLISGLRRFHTSSTFNAVDKSQLSKLRKKTGFPFINCKKALEKHDNDLVQAEKWLKDQAQKEGWAKASKLQDRPMSQGLVGLIKENNMAAMVEVNCETDFVSRNSIFRDLVAKATTACFEQGKAMSSEKVLWNKEAVNQLKVEDGRSLADLVAMEVGSIGENMALRRGVFLRCQPATGLIGHYVHSTGDNPKDKYCLMGKFGSLVSINCTSSDMQLSTQEMEDTGRQLCQHVVGMNPATIGYGQDENMAAVKDNETMLAHQEFLLDPTMTVGEFTSAKGVEMIDFVRFECGEELEEMNEEKLPTS